jgi:GNAT superfamily N-acetyltransferase
MKYDAAVLERMTKRFRRDMWGTAPPDAVAESGVEVRSFGSVLATAFAELAEVPRVNSIQGAAEPGAVEEGHLAAAIEWMREREVSYRVHVASGRPGTEAAEIWLAERGYLEGEGWEKFVRDTSPPDLAKPPGVEVIELEMGEGEGMDLIASEGLGLPHLAGLLFYDLPGLEDWRCYVALLGDDLVACGSMLVRDGIAELGVDATMEHARGRGCNQALLRRRLLDARAAGCHTTFVELGDCEPGSAGIVRRSLLRAGFEEAYTSQYWQRPGFTKSHSAHGMLRYDG